MLQVAVVLLVTVVLVVVVSVVTTVRRPLPDWSGTLEAVGLRDVDVREARRLLCVMLGVAGLTLGLYFGIPELHPPAAHELLMAARATLATTPLAQAATKTSLASPSE